MAGMPTGAVRPHWPWLKWIGYAILFLPGFLFFLPTFTPIPTLLYRQTGTSMPKGWYVFSHLPPLAIDEVVVIRDPPHFDLPWLMKRVVGVAGDRYCWDDTIKTQRLNGWPMPAPTVSENGPQPWRGCETIQGADVVGYGVSADSYDSRYLGIIPGAKLQGAYRLVLTDR